MSTKSSILSTLRLLRSGDSASKTGKDIEYKYFTLSLDTAQERCTIRLPPYPYVLYLVKQFTIYFGYDWHWVRLRKFNQQVETTYKSPSLPGVKDRTWLCKLLVVLAMGESASPNSTPSKNAAPEATSSPPGTEFFKQALKLLSIRYESASIEDVEVLNMIALYSNQLNRQKTAYMYAGKSARLCNMLQLHRADASTGYSPSEKEHRKRVWWSTFCLDRMTSMQRGFLPTLTATQTDLEYPSQGDISPDNAGDFTDPDYLTARIQLTIIQARVVSHLSLSEPADVLNVIGPMLETLSTWKKALPHHMASQIEDGLPRPNRSLPCIRSLANLYLRYNHCAIVLLRPMLLKQVALLYTTDEPTTPPEASTQLSDFCLDAARSSVGILINVHSNGLLARLGLMESVHLFTSLAIIRLSIWTRNYQSSVPKEGSDDIQLYDSGKELLQYMIHCGSLAAKVHRRMLQEVEDLPLRHDVPVHSQGEGVNQQDWDLDEWIARFIQSENAPIAFDI
ncbi:fungal specific transcription factor domain-containing protein [Aspergillus mulundensis]|uniref:Xylanolytic transcriptional activator regulatory domain-containing protein n=1 Tax=Aspergillus mulundensis TaxID=1810919 RepID=A0A3D8QN12_9EURO|nr:hypothetical protein DSM5745_10324 [Aspergillus mulundensis]RDW63213.1 hypothetical protein DSM5745_10324 [Aspergillus mulundensis]